MDWEERAHLGEDLGESFEDDLLVELVLIERQPVRGRTQSVMCYYGIG
jgi:hypothetical protein